MAFGVAVGSFVDGINNGVRLGVGLRNQTEARADRERQRKIEDEDRAMRLEDRQIAREQAKYDQERQRAADSREDAMRQTFADAVAETDAAVAAQSQGLPPRGGQPASPAGAALEVATAGGSQKPAAFTDLYMRIGVPKIVKAYLANGQPDRAQAFQSWVETEGVKKGMRSWADATFAASIGDEDGFLNHMVAAYNNRGYFDDGYTAIKEKSGFIRDENGAVTGAKITFRGPDGKEFERAFEGMGDLYREGVKVLAPEKVFEYGMSEVEKADAARAEAAKEARGLRTKIAEEDRAHSRSLEKSAYDSALRIEEDRAKAPGGDEIYQKRVAEQLKSLTENDLTFQRKPIDEQLAIARARVDAIYGDATAAPAVPGAAVVQPGAPLAPAVPAQRRAPPVWRDDLTGPGTSR